VFNKDDGHLWIYNETTRYWIRVAYDPQASIVPDTCGKDFLDIRDGNHYKTVRIGNQCWFAENINHGTMIDAIDPMNTNNNNFEKYCFEDLEANCDEFGGLYLWQELWDVQGGICPTGWRVTRDGDWKNLEGTLDTQYPVDHSIWDNMGNRGFDAGKNIKSTTGWNTGNGIDSYGFSALPAGYYKYTSGYYFHRNGDQTYFWSTLQVGLGIPVRELRANSDQISRSTADFQDYAFSVRCVRDL
jgi:uncharacterized protein (TIGR02145 family)